MKLPQEEKPNGQHCLGIRRHTEKYWVHYMDKLFLAVITLLILSLLALLTKSKWDDMPWGREKYSEPSLQDRSVR